MPKMPGFPPFSNPDHFHHDLPLRHPSHIFNEHENPNPSGPSTYRPPPGRPFLHPGNPEGLVEDENSEAPNPTLTEEFPVYEDRTFHDDSRPNSDYPIVASVFDDRPQPDVISGSLISVNDTTDTENDSYVDEVISASAGSHTEEERLETTGKDLEIDPSQLTISDSDSALANEENQQLNGTADEPLLTDYNNDYYDLYDEFMDMYYDADESNQSINSEYNQTSPTTLPITTPLPVSENTAPSTTESSQISSHHTEETSSFTSTTDHSSLPTSTSKIETLTDSSTIESLSSTVQSTSPTTTSTSAATTSTSTTIITTESTTSKLPLVTTTENVPEFTSTSSAPPSSSESPSTAKVNAEEDQTEKAIEDGLSSTGSNRREQTTPKQEEDSAISDKSEPVTTNQQRPGTNKGSSLISLSEILQGIGMSLPQFLVALKGHGMTLKDFTSSLQEKSLTQQQLRGLKVT
ncbi:uncharacterized protein [Palaemon carinicauda]|uniref:uncharacterized protein n=1 Tax=Palaemon carinicauda TaxID=392227 RepID=UPI0035B61F89